MARYVESVASWAILRIEGEGVQRKSTGFCARRDGALLIGSVLSVVGRCSVVGRLNAVRGVRIDGALPRDGPGVPRVLRKGDRDHRVQRPHLLLIRRCEFHGGHGGRGGHLRLNLSESE